MKKIIFLLILKEKKHILIVYNKCIFYSNDEKCKTWAKSDELPLCKKDNEKSIMISKFLTKAYRRFKLTAEQIENYPDILKEA